MTFDQILPVLTLIFGWFLSEGSHLLRKRGSHREAVRLALAELLELRHAMIGNRFLFDELASRVQLPASAIFQIKNSLPAPLQNDADLASRFNQALTEVAKHNPFLAFRLRGKNIVNLIEMAFHTETIQDERVAELAHRAHRDLYEEILPVLNDTIVSTAREAGLMDWARAFYHVRVRPAVGSEVRNAVDRLLTSLLEQLREKCPADERSSVDNREKVRLNCTNAPK